MSGHKVPDGGWLAWSQVVASFLILTCTLGLGNSFGAFLSYYENNTLQSYSSSSISWIGTVQGFLLSVIGIISGPLYDKGYVKSLMYSGMILNVIGLLGTSFAQQYQWIMLSLGVCIGLGCGAIYVPALAIIQSYFYNRLALATAIAISGSSVGGIIYPILFRQLNDGVGSEWTCRVFALMNGVLLLAACLITKPPPKPEEEDSEPETFDWKVFRDWKLLLLGGCALLLNMVVDVPYFYIPSFVQDKIRLPSGVEDSLLAGMNGSSLIGRILLSLLTRYLRPVVIWQFTILASCILLFCWSLAINLGGIIAFAILYGVCVGGLIALIPPSVRDLNPDPNTIGSRLGLVEAFEGIGFLVGPPIAGAIRDSPTGYLGISLLCGSLYLGLFFILGIFTWPRRDTESAENSPDMSSIGYTEFQGLSLATASGVELAETGHNNSAVSPRIA
ncbi:MFS general substrate transporter [Hypoxylon trugodes]|uniref:MFS general substrate transporter n=1 Tax=Hypoxylon trugodes TaxID=326681 RepID=UPI0021A1D873|nr:MFS general substrate transporter [Hypoxylon trugodes]KAI1387557.1 MFS general substrate transporter [Hypoxylon trugodes]